MARLLSFADCATVPILWLYAAYPAQTTIPKEAGRLNSSHCV
jgi:hypothetical protein